ncbi:hypothetical protein TASIC1_0007060900 [Trichoderma asperellum]|uniref:Uncharacterized protein n=1 Tax=Trichoderma asperellum TaxID=101201 RepID=A0A6V8QWW3_TRIAP|nr:hypothetical protein TASIC1_0007060900 [Trichoderma asperellum]
MRHRQPERQPWPCFAAVLQRFLVELLLFLFFFFTTASAYPNTPAAYTLPPSTTASASSSAAAAAYKLPSPARSRPSIAAAAPSDQLGHATPPSAADAALSTLVTIPLQAKLDDSAAASSASSSASAAAALLSTASSSSSSSSSPTPPLAAALPPGQDASMSDLGYRMTSEYTCTTIGGETFCRVHVPVLKADAPMRATDMRVVLAVVSCLAGILAWGLV